MNKKQVILRILFALTFLPYLFALGFIFFSYFFGITFLWEFYQGIEGIKIAIVILFYLLVIIPVIPVCLTIQLSVLAYKQMKKKNKEFSGKKLALGVGIALLAYIAIFICWVNWDDIMDLTSRPRADIFYYQSEEVIHYGDEPDVYVFGDKKFNNTTLMADWDRNIIAFVISDGRDIFYQYKLDPMSDEDFEKYQNNYSHFEHQSHYEFSNGNVMDTYEDHYDTANQATILIVITTPEGERLAHEVALGTYLNLNETCFNS